MPTDPLTWPEPLAVRHHPWTVPLRRPRMANDEDARPGLSLTNRYLLRDGAPIIPVAGEMHFSRTPRHRWAQRLRQMRAGGVTVVATYVFWIHHVERHGEPSFAGNLDVAAFLDLCERTGLEVILRIGPWCHGEVRNGGFPDWVQRAPVRHRTDDPAYLALVREWFGQLAAALDGRCSGGRVLGIQLENELYDQPEHLLTLKHLARQAGLSAPLWTATAWGGADLPPEEILPVYGGYGDGFWVDADHAWDPTFREHYLFSHVWDDPGIGADLRRVPTSAAQPRTPSELFPPATSELGGGMGTAYHRRPRPGALDVATVAHCKIGNGSAWQGYYMYAGGTNPTGEHGMQESHATGYPNDMQRWGYDFHAPIGEAGTPAPSHAELRRQHAFLTAFGASLADMPSSLPDHRPAGVADGTTLRWALRSDGESGFLFVAWHQPHVPLASYRGARFRVVLEGAELVLPSRAVDLPVGTLARWPLGFTAGGVRLAWATASALTVLPGAVPTLVLVAEAGIDVEIALAGVGSGAGAGVGDVVAGADVRSAAAGLGGGPQVRAVVPGPEPVRLTTAEGALDLLVLPAATAPNVWVCEDGPGRRLLLSADELSWGPDGRVEVRSGDSSPQVLAYDPAAGAFSPLPLVPAGSSGVAADSALAELIRPAVPTVPVSYGKHDGRQSAPSPEAFDDLAAVYRVPLPAWAADPDLDVLLQVSWAGDVGQLRVDGRTVTDRFWDGSRWTISLRDAGYRSGSELTLHLLPLAVGSTVHLPPDAGDRLVAADGQLLALDAVRVVGRRTWHER